MNKFTPKDKKELIRLIVGGISLDKIDVTLIDDMGNLFPTIANVLWQIEFSLDSDIPVEWEKECLTQEFFNGIEDWNTSNVVDMSGMFSGCKYFNSDISKWDTSNDWNVSNVEDMGRMFVNAKSFNQPLDKWKLKEVNIAYSNLSGKGIKVATNFYVMTMFEGCPLESNPPKWWKKYADQIKMQN